MRTSESAKPENSRIFYRDFNELEYNALRKLVVADNPALVQQIIALEADLSELETTIARQEAEMNTLIYALYGLTEDEARLVASLTAFGAGGSRVGSVGLVLAEAPGADIAAMASAS